MDLKENRPSYQEAATHVRIYRQRGLGSTSSHCGDDNWCHWLGQRNHWAVGLSSRVCVAFFELSICKGICTCEWLYLAPSRSSSQFDRLGPAVTCQGPFIHRRQHQFNLTSALATSTLQYEEAGNRQKEVLQRASWKSVVSAPNTAGVMPCHGQDDRWTTPAEGLSVSCGGASPD